jgi:hypothetical protein
MDAGEALVCPLEPEGELALLPVPLPHAAAKASSAAAAPAAAMPRLFRTIVLTARCAPVCHVRRH